MKVCCCLRLNCFFTHGSLSAQWGRFQEVPLPRCYSLTVAQVYPGTEDTQSEVGKSRRSVVLSDKESASPKTD